jgi:hypothetical protein
MGRRPRLPSPAAWRPASGWLALAVSIALHAAGLLLLWRVPWGSDPTDRPPPVVTCVLVADDQPADTATPARPSPPEVEPIAEEPERVFSPVVLPAEPVPVEAIGPPAGSAPVPAEPGAAGLPGPGLPAGRADNARPGTTFFQVAAEGAAVVYVIDCSASMGLNGGLSAARRELLASLGRLPGSARFQVIAYNRTAYPLRIAGRSDLVPAADENVRETAEFLARLRASGSTNHVEALRRALELGPDVIFLVTDADDLSPEQVRRVTQWNAGRAAIHAIELGGRDDSAPGGPLETLARSNRGTYRFVPPAGD